MSTFDDLEIEAYRKHCGKRRKCRASGKGSDFDFKIENINYSTLNLMLWDDSNENPQHRVWKRNNGSRIPSLSLIWGFAFTVLVLMIALVFD